MKNITLFWFRRDLRLKDNHGLFQALSNGSNVQPIFIFDKNILDKLEDRSDRRVSFIHKQLDQLNEELTKHGSRLWVFHDTPIEVFKSITEEHQITSLYTNRDYEPYARERDKDIYDFLSSKHIPFKAFKDHVIFEKGDVLKDDGSPYTVYSPYARKWKAAFREDCIQPFGSESILHNLNKSDEGPFLTLQDIGFQKHVNDWNQPEVEPSKLLRYSEDRDIPGIEGTTKISVHLRFGTVSIREMFRIGREHSEKWVNELIWREFYQMILWHYPKVVGKCFKPAYEMIEWRNNEGDFRAWCEGRTGYPIVDAGMRELNQTGFMHNRVRMIVASFLTKHLLIDWRWGEAYFAQKLLDFELASNNGGWQWAAGTGVDAAPYFRVFNPYIQTEKFDPNRTYIRKWVPEFESQSYPGPIVDHAEARDRAIATYQKALK